MYKIERIISDAIFIVLYIMCIGLLFIEPGFAITYAIFLRIAQIFTNNY